MSMLSSSRMASSALGASVAADVWWKAVAPTASHTRALTADVRQRFSMRCGSPLGLRLTGSACPVEYTQTRLSRRMGRGDPHAAEIVPVPPEPLHDTRFRSDPGCVELD